MKTTKSNNGGSLKRMVRCAFTASEACHILSLIDCNERNGEHTAPQDQYWKRSERIKAKLASTPNDQAQAQPPTATPERNQTKQ